MTYIEFIRQKPVLYGQIMVNGNWKIGSFRHGYSKWSGYSYQYYTEKGNRGTGGFTIGKAYNLLVNKMLSLDPEMGKSANYVSYH